MSSRLQHELESYRALALQLGMSDAKIIAAPDVILDPRVQMKCKYPRCGYYGSNGNCPPHAPSLSEMQACLDRYSYAIFMMKQFPSDELLGGAKADQGRATAGHSQREMYDVVLQLESAAFRDGHVLAMSFANGPCKKVFCAGAACSAIEPGGTCRFPLKSRSSMEGVGMSVFKMEKNVGWTVIPTGHSATPEQVPYLTCLGLVLVE